MSLFDDIVAASGLNEVVAPFTVSRLLVRADVPQPEQVSRDDLTRALPELERGIRVYLEKGEADDAIARLRALAGAG
jgi:hypothetical protein